MAMRPGHNQKDIDSGLDQNVNAILDREVEVMAYVGEGFINNCRNIRTYRDVTGNLRSSTGYVIAVDANVEIMNINAGSGTGEGINKGQALGKRLANDKNSTVLIGVAGMEYGTEVEARGKDVITGSGILAKKELESLLAEI